MVADRQSAAVKSLAAAEVALMHRYTIEINDKIFEVDVDEGEGKTYRVVVEGTAYAVRLVDDVDVDMDQSAMHLETEVSPAFEPANQSISAETFTEIRAPMPGVVLSIDVQPGDKVRMAQEIVILEAMKMKNPISSPRDGVVAEVVVQAGQSVGYDDILLRFERD